MDDGRDNSHITGPLLLSAAGLITAGCISYFNQGRELTLWPLKHRLVALAATMAFFGGLHRALTANERREWAEDLAHARTVDPSIPLTSIGERFASAATPIVMPIVGISLIPLLGLPVAAVVAVAGWGVMSWYSPINRIEVIQHAKVRAVQLAEEQARHAAWLLRLKEALVWWRAYGSWLFPTAGSTTFNAVRLEEYIRVHGQALLARRQQVLKGDPSDPCGTPAGAAAIASWAVGQQTEALAEVWGVDTLPSAGQLTEILRLHSKRDVLLLPEAEAMLFRKQVRATEPLEEPTIEARFARMVGEYDSILEFLSAARRDADARAAQAEAPDRERVHAEIMAVAHALAAEKLKRMVGL